MNRCVFSLRLKLRTYGDIDTRIILYYQLLCHATEQLNSSIAVSQSITVTNAVVLRLSVCLSVKIQYSIETAYHKTTQTTTMIAP